MKYAGFFVLLILTSCFAAHAQTIRQLIDSARSYKSNNYSKVISFAGAAYKKATASKQPALAGESAMMLGEGSYLAGSYKEALRWYFEAEKIYSSSNDKAGLAALYGEMCVFYVKNKAFKEADSVSKKAIIYSMAAKNTAQLATSVNNRGVIFMDEGKTDSAITSFRSSYILYKKLRDKIGMAYSLDYLSSALSENGAYTKALQAMNESKQLREGTGDKTGEAIAINNIGELYLKEKKPAEAAPYFIDAIAKAHALNYPDLEIYSYNMLAQTWQQLGKFKEAFQAQAKYLELNQKFEDAKNTKALQELQTRYETNKKEAQNKLLKAENNAQLIKLSRNRIGIYALIAIIALSVFLFYLLYNKYKLKQQARFNEAMLTEQRLRSQGIMDAEENERRRLAMELHDGVGQMLSAARRQVELNNVGGADEEALKMLDDSITELRGISHSMVPPSILNKNLKQAIEEFIARMNNNGSMAITIDWVNTDGLELDKTTTLMLYRSMQEIITNIFRHAKATSVHMELVNHDTNLNIMIYDNGVGFDKEQLQNGKGLGLKNIQSRIAYIGGSLQIDTMPLKGVTYTIEIPLPVTN